MLQAYHLSVCLCVRQGKCLQVFEFLDENPCSYFTQKTLAASSITTDEQLSVFRGNGWSQSKKEVVTLQVKGRKWWSENVKSQNGGYSGILKSNTLLHDMISQSCQWKVCGRKLCYICDTITPSKIYIRKTNLNSFLWDWKSIWYGLTSPHHAWKTLEFHFSEQMCPTQDFFKPFDHYYLH